MTIDVLLSLINQENININDIEIITVFVAQQYFLKREIKQLAEV